MKSGNLLEMEVVTMNSFDIVSRRRDEYCHWHPGWHWHGSLRAGHEHAIPGTVEGAHNERVVWATPFCRPGARDSAAAAGARATRGHALGSTFRLRTLALDHDETQAAGDSPVYVHTS